MVKTTATVTTSGRVIILGPIGESALGGNEGFNWANLIGLESVDQGLAMNATNNTRPIRMTSLGTTVAGWEYCQLTPAAITVQVMYTSPLQRSGGVAYIGRMKTLSDLSNNTRTWNEFAAQFISYNTPRLCAGGKLCLRGVQCSAVPYNMNALSEFTSLRDLTDDDFTWDDGRTTDFKGFAPIMIVNDLTRDTDTELIQLHAPLTLLVTVEWRVRFDPSNPAQASHSMRKPTTDGAWASAVKGASDMGHGVVDIVEAVADLGVDAGEYAWEGM